MCQRYPDTTKDQPDDIHDRGQATCIRTCTGQLNTERSETNDCELKTLESKGNAHYGEAQYKSADNIFEKDKDATKDHPDDIAK